MTLIGDASSLAPVVVGLPAVLLNAGYSRAFERESDFFAAQLLRQRGNSRGTFVDILRRLERSQSKSMKIPAFLSTHSVTDERIEAYLAAWDEATNVLPRSSYILYLISYILYLISYIE